MNGEIKVISFDADDTLWVNEPYYRETENLFAEQLLNNIDILPNHHIDCIVT